MSNSPMIPMFSPDGVLGYVPVERLKDATAAGGKVAIKMQAPNGGDVGYVPADKANDAVKAGGKSLPYDTEDFGDMGKITWEGTKKETGNVLKQQVAGLNPLTKENLIGSAVDPTHAMRGTYNAINEAVMGWQRGKSAPGKLWEAISSAAASPFVSAEAQAEHAKKGESNKILAETAVPAVETALTYGAGKGAGKLIESLPSAEHAGAALQEVKAAAGDVPIDMAKPGNTALELWEQSERGANLPAAVRKFVQRATKPGSEPITYAEAKDFQSNVSSLSADEKMALKPNTKRLLGQLNADLKGSLEDAADTQGKGKQFVDAMKEYHNAMRLKGMTEAAIDMAWKAALGAVGIGAAKKIYEAF